MTKKVYEKKKKKKILKVSVPVEMVTSCQREKCSACQTQYVKYVSEVLDSKKILNVQDGPECHS